MARYEAAMRGTLRRDERRGAMIIDASKRYYCYAKIQMPLRLSIRYARCYATLDMRYHAYVAAYDVYRHTGYDIFDERDTRPPPSSST